MGLSIVKSLAELMGGTVRVDSHLHHGSTFILQLPFGIVDNQVLGGFKKVTLSQPADLKPSSNQRDQLQGLNILVVDDSDINLNVTRRTLQTRGATVTACDSGEEAIKILHRPGTAFDLVLMDLQMPGLDGCETTKLLRAEAAFAKLPIVEIGRAHV